MKPKKDTCCSFCGAKYADTSRYPRVCWNCNNAVWRNPVPVAVVIQPVLTVRREGVLVVRRGIDPERGKLALPGGFMDIETLEEAAARELREETRIVAPPEKFRQLWVRSSTTRNQVMGFCIAPPIAEADLPSYDDIAADSNGEVTEVRVLYAPEELAFSSHTEALTHYLSTLR
jgi:ADP-ribose pyrophosphatase YjhB (NUDIX family)